ncbi:hypothetical protein GCM10010156_72290 [Planobispora rosea]|uniref:Uncharacterized protein n=1 Tax=Planobispora rosea TaxID=35762 RepID=A0A8J3SBN5_PLARO|nr:hypothetical protein GCM10010156_72290 [Planobispora rosea]GIH88794.1 hypothetical protein Pro02_72020 [Planobispora rosea]
MLGSGHEVHRADDARLRSAPVELSTTVIAVAAHHSGHGAAPPLLALIPVVVAA